MEIEYGGSQNKQFCFFHFNNPPFMRILFVEAKRNLDVGARQLKEELFRTCGKWREA